MPIFQDSEASYPVVPEADYNLTVFSWKHDLSTGQKTSGCPRYNVVFLIEGTESKVKDQLIDHPSCAWKIDHFLKACGLRKLAKGFEFEFSKEAAEERGVYWINPMGLRCRAHLIQDTYRPTNGGDERTNNKVSIYFTEAPVLAPDPVLRTKSTE